MKKLLVFLIKFSAIIIYCANLSACSSAGPAHQQPAAPPAIPSPIPRAPEPAIFVFAGEINGVDGIYQGQAGATTVRLLAQAPEGVSCPAFSPDGGQIAYCAGVNGESLIYLMDASGNSPHALTDTIHSCTCSPDAHLSWSPNGQWILLPAAGPDQTKNEFDLFIVSKDGSKTVNLTSGMQRYGGLTWTPDSQYILYSGTFNGQADIHRLDISTLKSDPLFDTPFIGAASEWSPDGKSLLLFGDEGTGDFEVYMLPAGSGEPVNLTNSPGFDSYPQWFPDGKRILFNSKRDGNNEIYVMNADGSDPRNLTANPESMDIWESLSPDGHYILFNSVVNNQWDIWLMNSDGTNKQKMTEYLGIPRAINWKP